MSTYQQFISNQKHYRDIYEDHYKCCILPGYDVHHKDFNHDNDDPENLELLTRSEHMSEHANNDPNHNCRNCDSVKRMLEASHKLPKTEKQRKQFENIREMGLNISRRLPRTDLQKESLIRAAQIAHILPRTDKQSNQILIASRSKIGKIRINNGIINKYANLMDFESGLYPGYRLGMIPKQPTN